MVVRVLLQLPLARLTRVLRPLPLPRVVLKWEVVVLVLSRVEVVAVPVLLIVVRVVGTPAPANLLSLMTPLVKLDPILESRECNRVLCRESVVPPPRVPIRPSHAPVRVRGIVDENGVTVTAVYKVFAVNIVMVGPRVPPSATWLSVLYYRPYITVLYVQNVI